ncbi:hypothetical protein AB0C41_32865, partial [Micromonospora taraxaci]|uniref:hypothetical protein n=1 Tax=Micromonospora taraxaci TaxID=1316803 RepID=UPI0033D77464
QCMAQKSRHFGHHQQNQSKAIKGGMMLHWLRFAIVALPLLPNLARATSAETLAAYAERKIKPWQSKHCEPPTLTFPRWVGFPVQLCQYTDDALGVSVTLYMLNADKSRQAAWTVTACQDAGSPNYACIDYMVDAVRTASSGGIFPVSGYMPEPQYGGRCYVFRDGVTIWTVKRPFWQSPKNRSCGDFVEQDDAVGRVWAYARISSTTREDYASARGNLPTADTKWMDTIRTLYQEAWNSPRNALMSATAMAAKRRKEF